MTLLEAVRKDSRAGALRFAGLDRLRGLAIVLMVADHALLVFMAPEWTRLNLTRLALPIFMIVGGSLFGRLKWRHLGIFLIGCTLPMFATWMSPFDILAIYVLGCVALHFLHTRRQRYALLIVCLTFGANGFWIPVAGYPLLGVVALMTLGSLFRYESVAHFGIGLPKWLGAVGRYPVSIYVVSSLLLQLVWLWW